MTVRTSRNLQPVHWVHCFNTTGEEHLARKNCASIILKKFPYLRSSKYLAKHVLSTEYRSVKHKLKKVMAQLNSGMYRVFLPVRPMPEESELLLCAVRMSKPYVATISSCDLGAWDRSSKRSCCHFVLSNHNFLADLRTSLTVSLLLWSVTHVGQGYFCLRQSVCLSAWLLKNFLKHFAQSWHR